MSYPPDEQFRSQVLDLLGSVWSGLPVGVRQAQQWGADWFAVSTPFTSEAAGNPVGVVGVIEMPLCVAGRAVDVAGVHGVCVHPEYRGHGHLRRAMEAALAFVDDHWSAAVLWAEQPDIYRRWGFRPLVEPAFATQLVRGHRASLSCSHRKLDLANTVDRQLLVNSLAHRAPVSLTSGTRDPGWHFIIALGLSPHLVDNLHYLPDLDSIVVAEPIEHGMRLHDVIAPSVPSLRDIVDTLDIPSGRLEVLFTPDRLDAPELAPAPHPDPSPIMVRGALDLEPLVPFAFPPLARC